MFHVWKQYCPGKQLFFYCLGCQAIKQSKDQVPFPKVYSCPTSREAPCNMFYKFDSISQHKNGQQLRERRVLLNLKLDVWEGEWLDLRTHNLSVFIAICCPTIPPWYGQIPGAGTWRTENAEQGTQPVAESIRQELHLCEAKTHQPCVENIFDW